ncbi:MAG: Na+/H+ antiporter subunit C [OCS116 cluster bacterium]|uniref:Cation:proton antiporter n=1 Tax=OCS116 cluster bacterium TaxID=2030921 RepID=A0A2A4Z8G7_9PROT|nr:Na+/H+ antiporter subunit C [OCS116 cluster bacterium]
MEFYLTILVGLIFAASTYMMQSRSVIRLVLGVALLGNAVNLLIFTVGRVTRDIPPIIPKDFHGTLTGIANPLPQALILTAIVIGFALFAFVLVLTYRAYESLGTDNSDDMRIAEPEKTQASKLTY